MADTDGDGGSDAAASLPALAPLLGQNSTALTIYWLIAIGAGPYVTWLWYLRHGRQVGLMTPARGFVIAGVVVGLLCLVLPAFQLVPGDLMLRGTLPFLIVAAGLWVLAWAQRRRSGRAACRG